MVLGSRADHRRPANVDILNDLVAPGPARHRLRERVEVHDQQIDRPDPVRAHRRFVRRIAAHRQQPAMNLRMERLHPPVHHLGKAGQLGHVPNLQPRLPQRPGGAAGRHQLDAVPRQRPPQLGEPGLVGDGQQGPADANVSHQKPLFFSDPSLRAEGEAIHPSRPRHWIASSPLRSSGLS